MKSICLVVRFYSSHETAIIGSFTTPEQAADAVAYIEAHGGKDIDTLIVAHDAPVETLDWEGK
jgi:hypothetical protein